MTEGRHPKSADLDTLSSREIVALLLEEDRTGIEAALAKGEKIAQAADWVAETLATGGDLVFAGAGTSGRLGILEAAECPPTFGTDPERIRAVMAGGQMAVFKAQEGAEDRFDDGQTAVDDLGPGDLLVGLSASSVTPYARGALAQARQQGARTVLVTCAAGKDLEEQADLLIALETGPEILTGSTRLKAGSATKAVLNAITTAAMVHVGKVYENLMVDLRPGSAKLQDRAVRIVESAGQLTREEAERLIRAADGEVKTAIVMARCQISAGEARERLSAASGHVRPALAGFRNSKGSQ
ncbi:MAG: N-acetylmuramic acid 6-phosphate etherase [Thermoanaerobaculia bacterium]